MKRKVLASLLVIAVVVGLVGASTWAQFSDVEESSGNIFQSGTIDLAVNDENPWGNAFFELLDIKPCHDLDPITVAFENVGNNDGILTFGVDYADHDKAVDESPDFEFSQVNDPGMEMTADEFAALLYVKAVTQQYTYEGYDGGVQNDLPKWLAMDLNGDGKVSLREMKLVSPIDWGDTPDDPLPAGHRSTFVVTFHLGDAFDEANHPGKYWIISDGTTVWNVPQADGVDLTVTATLDQVP